VIKAAHGTGGGQKMDVTLGEIYLLERGLSLETARAHGIEIDATLERSRIEERLGRNCVKVWNLASELVWFPVVNSSGTRTSWIGRPLPNIKDGPKFLTPVGGSGQPYIPKDVYRSVKLPLIITEGPVKALILLQAGFPAIGLNGVWCAQESTPDGKLVLRRELAELGLRGRKVYLALDTDAASNPSVRHASVRLFFLLGAVGAEVFQLSSWDETRGKGIDDYLVNQTHEEPKRSSADVVRVLMANAQPFLGSFTKGKVDLDAVESELAKVSLSSLLRDQLCKDLATPLGVRTEVLRNIGKEERKTNAIEFLEELEPWPERVEGQEILGGISAVIRRHVVLSTNNLVAVTLWIVLTYLTEMVDTVPLLSITSPEKRCGKTRLLTLVQRLVNKALISSNISPASIYRVIEKWSPTLLVDEADTFLKDNDELRGVINSGHTRSAAYVVRVNPVTLEPERFSTFGPKVIAMIGRMPSTLEDRSIHIKMERRTRKEQVKPLRATPLSEFEILRCKLLRWVDDHKEMIAKIEPKIPECLNDRAADNWLPLLAIAQATGSDWPTKTLAAIASFNAEEDDDSVVTILLLSLRDLFKERNIRDDEDFLSTHDILETLNSNKEAPWADFRQGAGLSARKLSNYLKAFQVKSVELQKHGNRAWGYKFGALRPVFERYLKEDADPTRS
jgi:hypothetical protein